jgi:energy-coupling factor transporter ATP-binding protein EcfA2
MSAGHTQERGACVVVYGPQGCGKTTYKEQLRVLFGCGHVVDHCDESAYQSAQTSKGTLFLTNCNPPLKRRDDPPDRFRIVFFPDALGMLRESQRAAKVIAAREHTHGNYINNAHIAQRLKEVMRDGRNWNATLSNSQRESLEQIATKIARILSGDPNHVDSWLDIAGYAQLCVP